ncbi:MAG: transcriptional repressor [Verrucomicrobiota bacterium]
MKTPASDIDPAILDRFEAFIKEKGLRRTGQRDVIVAAAFSTDSHFTAEELWEMARKIDPSTSRATLYRTLALLTESDLLQEIDLGRDQKYYDPNFVDHPNHNHLICLDCGKVVEFADEHMAVLEDCVTRRLGFSSVRKEIRIEARCEEFQNTGKCKKAKT